MSIQSHTNLQILLPIHGKKIADLSSANIFQNLLLKKCKWNMNSNIIFFYWSTKFYFTSTAVVLWLFWISGVCRQPSIWGCLIRSSVATMPSKCHYLWKARRFQVKRIPQEQQLPVELREGPFESSTRNLYVQNCWSHKKLEGGLQAIGIG